MSLESTLDAAPVWNKKIAEWMKPAEPCFNWILAALALVCILGIFYLKPQYKALLIAVLVTP